MFQYPKNGIICDPGEAVRVKIASWLLRNLGKTCQDLGNTGDTLRRVPVCRERRRCHWAPDCPRREALVAKIEYWVVLR